MKVPTTISSGEVLKFSRISSEWWNPTGKFHLLHKMNPTRIRYIQQVLKSPLSNRSVLDVGCGGGILSEALGRLGGQVLGIDASEQNVQVATLHASKDPMLRDSLRYQCITAETLVETGERFDVVCALEVIEHVSDPKLFMRSLSSLLKENGVLFVSTINKTAWAYLTSVLLAEHVIGLVPVGTHDYEKYLAIENCITLLRDSGLEVDVGSDICGTDLNLGSKWSLKQRVDYPLGDAQIINYILAARRRKSP